MHSFEIYCDDCGDITVKREEHWAETSGQYEPLFCPYCGADVEVYDEEDDE